MLNRAFLLLGGNQGNRVALLREAVSALSELGQLASLSAIYQTQAWGLTDQPPYLNQALELWTSLDAFALLEQIWKIESQLGRSRHQRWAARTMDIDILYFNAQISDLPALTLPHPRLHLRRFVLVPLCQIAPDMVHPIFEKKNHELLNDCQDDLEVSLYQEDFL